MTLNMSGILDAVVSQAATLGYFDMVNAHEPKSAPGSGLTLAVWVQRTDPVGQASGLNAVTVRLEFNVRIFQNMIAEPQDAIDPNMMAAADALMSAYCSHFTLGGLVRNVDIKGAHGAGLGLEAGYIEQDKKMYRVMTITLPLIVNDLWTEVA